MWSLFFIACLCVRCSLSAVDTDEITELPGYNGTLPSKQYSGLLQVPNTTPARFYHYWLVESENDPTNDPLVFWYNGGPGASSLLGYFVELGPFNLNDRSSQINSTAVPVPFYNQYSWSKIANLVFVESPAGVGFSFCNGDHGPIDSCPDWNDTLVAQDNHAIMQQFFKAYPEFMSNDFYIFGESYAGIYIPTLVMEIEKDASSMPPLKGFGVGDGCTGLGGFGGCNRDAQGNFWQFMWGHSQTSTAIYENIVSVCGSSLYFGNETEQCQQIMGEARTNLGGYNGYNIYDECYLENDQLGQRLKRGYMARADKEDAAVRLINQKLAFDAAQSPRKHSDSYTSGINEYACGGERNTAIYLNRDEVKQAIHVPFIPWTWQDGAWSKYTSTQTDEVPYYQKWAKKYKILIYYGDVDAVVPYNGGETWTTSLGFPIAESWRPWTVDGAQMMAGYVQIFKAGDMNFTYATVRGAGHLVPQYKPEEALKLFDIFLNDKEWPEYGGAIGPH